MRYKPGQEVYVKARYIKYVGIDKQKCIHIISLNKDVFFMKQENIISAETIARLEHIEPNYIETEEEVE